MNTPAPIVTFSHDENFVARSRKALEEQWNTPGVVNPVVICKWYFLNPYRLECSNAFERVTG